MTPEWLQALVLGIVQGLTEFIPVSSSGHLVLVPYWLGWEKPSLAFDVALHAGTAVAIFVYFRRELWGMLAGFVRGGASPEGAMYRRLGLLLIAASVPVAVVGLLAATVVESAAATPGLAAGFLVVTAGILVAGESVRDRRVRREPPAELHEGPTFTSVSEGGDPSDPSGTTLGGISLRQAVAVGGAQVLALLPGISRSGTTITAGVIAGLTRPAATRFSFLLALPALVGAFAVSAPDLAEPGLFSGRDIALGVAASSVSGYAAIAFLIRLVTRVGLRVFSIYLVAAGGLSLVLVALGR